METERYLNPGEEPEPEARRPSVPAKVKDPEIEVEDPLALFDN